MDKKKIAIIALAVILAIVLVLSLGLFTKKMISNTRANKQAETKDVVADINKEVDENEDSNNKDVVKKTKSKFMAYGKDGLITLYNENGEVLDTQYLREMLVASSGIESRSKLASAIEDSQTVIDLGNKTEAVNSKMEDGVLRVFDKNGLEIKRLDMASLEKLEDETVNDLVPLIGEAVKTEETDKEIINPDTIKTPVVITESESFSDDFQIYYTVDGQIVFRDIERNILFLVNSEEDAINVKTLLLGYDLDKMKTIAINEDNIYIVFNDENMIREIPVLLATKGNIKDTSVKKYKVSGNPDYIFLDKDNLYYTLASKLGQYSLKSGENRTIEVGDRAVGLFTYNEHIYMVNQFGKGLKNSVLMKIEKNTLMVNSIMELKGINSEYVGSYDNIAYFKQAKSIKSVDLETLKPLKTYERVNKEPLQSSNGMFYELVDGKVIIFDIDKRSEVISELEVNGSQFRLIK